MLRTRSRKILQESLAHREKRKRFPPCRSTTPHRDLGIPRSMAAAPIARGSPDAAVQPWKLKSKFAFRSLTAADSTVMPNFLLPQAPTLPTPHHARRACPSILLPEGVQSSRVDPTGAVSRRAKGHGAVRVSKNAPARCGPSKSVLERANRWPSSRSPFVGRVITPRSFKSWSRRRMAHELLPRPSNRSRLQRRRPTDLRHVHRPTEQVPETQRFVPFLLGRPRTSTTRTRVQLRPSMPLAPL